MSTKELLTRVFEFHNGLKCLCFNHRDNRTEKLAEIMGVDVVSHTPVGAHIPFDKDEFDYVVAVRSIAKDWTREGGSKPDFPGQHAMMVDRMCELDRVCSGPIYVWPRAQAAYALQFSSKVSPLDELVKIDVRPEITQTPQFTNTQEVIADGYSVKYRKNSGTPDA